MSTDKDCSQGEKTDDARWEAKPKFIRLYVN